MSNPLSVAAVTATLRNLLDQGVRDNPAGTTVTARPPDKARGTISSNQLNVFLYHTTIDAAWRNHPLPEAARPGEAGQPPLPLVLYYLVTAYGENDEDALGHQVLGRAMNVLHDHPRLSPDDIRQTLGPDVGKYDLQDQREGVRITFQPMSLEEISKLWTAFQSQYRISAAYQVSVVLIESTRPARAALPVLTQGPADTGPAAQADLTPPFPALTDVSIPDPTGVAVLGDVVTVTGHHLSADTIQVLVTHPRLDAPLTVVPSSATDTQLSVRIPNDAAAADAWASGLLAVQGVLTTTAGGTTVRRTTNELPLPLAPSLTAISPEPLVLGPGGSATLTVSFAPRLAPGQRARLILGDQEITPEPASGGGTPSSLDFAISGVAPGDYFVRLRVDGVDSLLVDRTATPPRFDPARKLTVQ